MTWTTTPPKKAGYYWFRGDAREKPHPVRFTEGQVVYLSDEAYGLTWFDEAYPDCQWSSEPIPQPK